MNNPLTISDTGDDFKSLVHNGCVVHEVVNFFANSNMTHDGSQRIEYHSKVNQHHGLCCELCPFLQWWTSYHVMLTSAVSI